MITTQSSSWILPVSKSAYRHIYLHSVVVFITRKNKKDHITYKTIQTQFQPNFAMNKHEQKRDVTFRKL